MDPHPCCASTRDEPILDVVPSDREGLGRGDLSARDGQQGRLPPAFSMITFVLMLPVFFGYWALVALATRVIAEPDFADLPSNARESVYLELLLPWIVSLSGISASITLLLTRLRIGLWLGRLAILALVASIVMTLLDTFVLPARIAEGASSAVFVIAFAIGLMLRVGLGIWFAAALSQYARWLARQEESPHSQPEWMRAGRFSDST